jgi:hypothetical protein
MDFRIKGDKYLNAILTVIASALIAAVILFGISIFSYKNRYQLIQGDNTVTKIDTKTGRAWVAHPKDLKWQEIK